MPCENCGKGVSDEAQFCSYCGTPTTDVSPVPSMSLGDYTVCVSNLGLVEGEEIGLMYGCRLVEKVGEERVKEKSFWTGKEKEKVKPLLTYPEGLLVLTSDNLLFMRSKGGEDYSQAIRLPLERVVGIDSAEYWYTPGLLIPKLAASVTFKTDLGDFQFIHEARKRQETGELAGAIRGTIESHLESVRAERKKAAQQVLSGETELEVIFCRYCGSRNQADTSHCSNCGALIT